jgi:hypothetical protein
MTTAADRPPPAGPTASGAARRTGRTGWALRAVVTAHTIAAFGQPVFAGVYLSGDYDGLRWHVAGADTVTSIGYLQVVAAAVVWGRLRLAWPFLATLALVAAETVQYLLGMTGALWAHFPLGVATIAGLVVMFVGVWCRPLDRRARPSRARARATTEAGRREAGDA